VRLGIATSLGILILAPALAAAQPGGAMAGAKNPTPNPVIDPLKAVPKLTDLVNARTSELAEVVNRYSADQQSISGRYDGPDSPMQRRRMRAFYDSWRTKLKEVAFDRLSQEAKVDYVLLDNILKYQLALLDRADKERGEQAALMPFADRILTLQDDRREMKRIDGKVAARELTLITKAIDSIRTLLEAPPNRAPGGGSDMPAAGITAPRATRTVANRAAADIDQLRGMLLQWYRYYEGYDPVFTWWMQDPVQKAEAALTSYSRTIRQRLVGLSAAQAAGGGGAPVAPGGGRGGGGGGGGRGGGAQPLNGGGAGGAAANDPIIGDPIGRDGLMADLVKEMIPYTPEELIEIAEKEYAFNLSEAKKAAREMGFGDNWKAAMDKVKDTYVDPGEQPELIRRLAREAEAFFEGKNWITIPDLAREDWRMEMISPDRQRVSPFFLGGASIQVSYPTNEMTNDEKLNSLRGNNPHFSHATVFHELNPGHHLQGFMTARYNTHRRIFNTPFWNEGSALYWEFFLWDHDFHVTPEDRMGALFWRMHRSARIVFSLNFHLGNWTPERAIKYLVDTVNFEPNNAEGEVRRSFGGAYSPLYQAGYMLGGLQLRALYRELVESKKMTELAFHDAIYMGGPMPIAMVRARLGNIPLTRDGAAPWKFYADMPPHKPRPERAPGSR
jgi:uncharacterized protein (DUF885 family)